MILHNIHRRIWLELRPIIVYTIEGLANVYKGSIDGATVITNVFNN